MINFAKEIGERLQGNRLAISVAGWLNSFTASLIVYLRGDGQRHDECQAILDTLDKSADFDRLVCEVFSKVHGLIGYAIYGERVTVVAEQISNVNFDELVNAEEFIDREVELIAVQDKEPYVIVPGFTPFVVKISFEDVV